MKHKKHIVIISTVLAAAILFTGCAAPQALPPQAAENPTEQTQTEVSAETAEPAKESVQPETAAEKSSSKTLTVEDAKKIALDRAGISEADAKFLRTELDTDPGKISYEIEFVADSTEYEYDIDAVTGKILKEKREQYALKNSTTEPAQKSDTTEPAQKKTSAEYIGKDAAEKTALSHAGVSADGAQFRRTELDRERKTTVYEVEFYADGVEYEYEVDAVTGKILKADREKDQPDRDDRYDDDRDDHLDDLFDDDRYDRDDDDDRYDRDDDDDDRYDRDDDDDRDDD